MKTSRLRLLLVVAGLLVAYSSAERVAARSLRLRIEEVARSGAPTSIADVRGAEWPGEHDAAVLYCRADARLVALDWTELETLVRRDPPRPGSSIPSWLESNAEALALLHEAARRPCVGLAGLGVDAPRLYGAGLLLAAESLELARAGRVEQALASLEAVVACVRALDGVVWAGMSRLDAIEALAEAIEGLAVEGWWPAGRSQDWRVRLRALLDRGPLIRALENERAIVLDYYRQAESAPGSWITYARRHERWPPWSCGISTWDLSEYCWAEENYGLPRLAFHLEVARYLDRMSAILALARRPHAEVVVRLRELEPAGGSWPTTVADRFGPSAAVLERFDEVRVRIEEVCEPLGR